MKNGWSFLMILIVGLMSCAKQDSFVRQEDWDGELVTVFDVTEEQEATDTLKLSELVKSFRVVPLETSDESLISGRARYYAGDSCILVFQENQISLFDTEGRFVRVIARQGRAPMEYYGMSDYAVDEKDNMLYIVERYAEGGIKGYHLKDSAYFKKIETLERAGHAGIACLENGNFLLVPYPYNKVKYAFYQQTPEGELGEYALCHSSRTGIHIGSRPLLFSAGDVYRYRSDEHDFSDDTIFRIRGNELIPVWLFKRTNLRHYRADAETPDWLFLTVSFVQRHEKIEMEGGTSERIESISYAYTYHKKTGKLTAVCSFLKDDLWAHATWRSFNWHFQEGHKLCVVCPVADLLHMAEVRRQQGTLSVPAPEWNEVVGRLTEEDNPVLLIGDLK